MRTLIHMLRIGLPIALIAGVVGTGLVFAQPSAQPPQGNVSAPINTSSIDQRKSGGLWADNMIADTIDALSKICLGSSGCRSSWPSGGEDFSATCQVNRLLVADNDERVGIPHDAPNPEYRELGFRCRSQLDPSERNQWTLVGFDRCPGVSSRDCDGASYCHFIQFECSAGIDVESNRLTR